MASLEHKGDHVTTFQHYYFQWGFIYLIRRVTRVNLVEHVDIFKLQNHTHNEISQIYIDRANSVLFNLS